MNCIRISTLISVLMLMTSCERQVQIKGPQPSRPSSSEMHPPISAGMSLSHMFGDWNVINHYPLIIVARVVQISEAGGESNGSPPQLTVMVERVLKGNLKRRTMQAIWQPFPHSVDWSGDGAMEAIAEWESLPNPPPLIETQWIMCGRVQNGVFSIAPRCRYAATRGNVEWVRSVLRDRATADGPPDSFDPVPKSPHPIQAHVPR